MRPLSAAQLLDAWEKGLSEPASSRALPLLAAASADASTEAVAVLSIGERDRRLLTLRSWLFGTQLPSLISCSTCNERLEWTVDSADLCLAKPLELSDELLLEMDQYRVSFRLPNSSDLVAVAGCTDVGTARWSLLDRCISTIEREGKEISLSELSGPIADDVVKRMGEVDPHADMQFDLTCPACGHRWRALFDIESFFWSEINTWAQRVLSEVHTLARAYGWSERDILNLSPWRRQFYLGLVGG